MRKRLKLLLFTACLLLYAGLIAACVSRATVQPTPAAEKPAMAPNTKPVPKLPKAELKILKVHGVGSGRTDAFLVKLQWTGKEPTTWKVSRGAALHDKTGQSQTLLVIRDQSFEIRPGEPTTVQVQAISIGDFSKQAPKNLIIDYEGMPVYQLTSRLENEPALQALDKIDTLNAGLEQMKKVVEIKGTTIEYEPKDTKLVAPYLEIVKWDMNVKPPRPYIEDTVLKTLFAVLMRNQNAVSQAEFKSILQELGIAVPEDEAQRIRQTTNKALSIVGSKIHLDKY